MAHRTALPVSLEVGAQSDRYVAILLPLATVDKENLASSIHMIDPQGTDFTAANAGLIEHFEHGTIS